MKNHNAKGIQASRKANQTQITNLCDSLTAETGNEWTVVRETNRTRLPYTSRILVSGGDECYEARDYAHAIELLTECREEHVPAPLDRSKPVPKKPKKARTK